MRTRRSLVCPWTAPAQTLIGSGIISSSCHRSRRLARRMMLSDHSSLRKASSPGAPRRRQPCPLGTLNPDATRL